MDISPFSLSNSAKNCRHRHAENCRIFLIGTRGRPTHINNQKGTTASNAERPAFCAHKSAPSSRPSADPLAWISLDLHGWTPCMHLSVCLSSLRFSSGRMNPVLGGALQSAAPLCEGCAANCLRHSHLVALPHHRSGRPTHPEGSRASLWRRGFASQPLPCAGAHFQSRALLHTRSAPTAISQPAGAGVSYGLRAERACPSTHVDGSR